MADLRCALTQDRDGVASVVRHRGAEAVDQARLFDHREAHAESSGLLEALGCAREALGVRAADGVGQQHVRGQRRDEVDVGMRQHGR